MRRAAFAQMMFLFLPLTLPLHAQSDGGITVWPKGIPPGGIAQKSDFGDHILSVSHREKDGEAELHTKKADVMVIQSGTATLITGGEVIDPRTVAPNEIHGSGVRGGVKRTVSAGDVIEIPVGIPHQFLVAPGTEITYFLVKIVKKQ